MKEAMVLTNAEWSLMECLWEKNPRTGREAVDYLRQMVGWSKSTTLTMLRRMAEKGLISCDEGGPVRLYSPLVDRNEAVTRETKSFLERVYKGSVSMMISSLTSHNELSAEEIERLYGILRHAEEAGK